MKKIVYRPLDERPCKSRLRRKRQHVGLASHPHVVAAGEEHAARRLRYGKAVCHVEARPVVEADAVIGEGSHRATERTRVGNAEYRVGQSAVRRVGDAKFSGKRGVEAVQIEVRTCIKGSRIIRPQ